MKVDPSNYDYVMYVDASGDDGFKFDRDSSSCYVAAALLVKQEDIASNLEILKQIKKIIGCKDTDEVKYSRIRRHRRGPEALSLLKNIRGKLSCYVIFKKEVDQEEFVGNKILSVSCHAMALHAIDLYDFLEADKVLIAIDRMKNTEEAPLKTFLDKKHGKATVVFRDSKDANYLLIQIADLLCGSIREHFEQYEENTDMLHFANKCPICRHLTHIKHNNRPLCTHGRGRAANIMRSSAFQYVFPLFPITDSINFLDYFFVMPSKMMDQHFYLLCSRKK